MAFNRNTFHANKNARTAWSYLAEARAAREGMRDGAFAGWRTERIASRVALARSFMRVSVGFRRKAEPTAC